MTDEKRKPGDDEVTEEQLEDVAGGATAPKAGMEPLSTKQVDMASVPLADFVSDHTIDTINLDHGAQTDDED